MTDPTLRHLFAELTSAFSREGFRLAIDSLKAEWPQMLRATGKGILCLLLLLLLASFILAGLEVLIPVIDGQIRLGSLFQFALDNVPDMAAWAWFSGFVFLNSYSTMIATAVSIAMLGDLYDRAKGWNFSRCIMTAVPRAAVVGGLAGSFTTLVVILAIVVGGNILNLPFEDVIANKALEYFGFQFTGTDYDLAFFSALWRLVSSALLHAACAIIGAVVAAFVLSSDLIRNPTAPAVRNRFLDVAIASGLISGLADSWGGLVISIIVSAVILVVARTLWKCPAQTTFRIGLVAFFLSFAPVFSNPFHGIIGLTLVYVSLVFAVAQILPRSTVEDRFATPEPLAAVVERIPSGKALLRVTQPKRLPGCAAAFMLDANGQTIGEIRNGETKEFMVDAGELELSVRLRSFFKKWTVRRSLRGGCAYALRVGSFGRHDNGLMLEFVDHPDAVPFGPK